MNNLFKKQMNEQFLKLSQLDRMEYTQRKEKIMNWSSGFRGGLNLGVIIFFVSILTSYLTVASISSATGNTLMMQTLGTMVNPMVRVIFILMIVGVLIFLLEEIKRIDMLRKLRHEYFKFEVKLKKR